MENNDKTNNQDDNDSGFNSEEDALIILKKKRTKAQKCYRKANAAVIPDFIPPEERKATDCTLKETRVFTPCNGLTEQQVWKHIRHAATYGFNMEQAMALLHCNKYNLEKARDDLKIFAPLPSQWPQDKSAFINAYKEEEKYFYAIKERFFPNRSVADIVEYYYTWKMEKKKRKIRDQWRKAQLLQMKMQLKKACPQRDIATAVCRKSC